MVLFQLHIIFQVGHFEWSAGKAFFLAAPSVVELFYEAWRLPLLVNVPHNIFHLANLAALLCPESSLFGKKKHTAILSLTFSFFLTPNLHVSASSYDPPIKFSAFSFWFQYSLMDLGSRVYNNLLRRNVLVNFYKNIFFSWSCVRNANDFIVFSASTASALGCCSSC